VTAAKAEVEFLAAALAAVPSHSSSVQPREDTHAKSRKYSAAAAAYVSAASAAGGSDDAERSRRFSGTMDPRSGVLRTQLAPVLSTQLSHGDECVGVCETTSGECDGAAKDEEVAEEDEEAAEESVATQPQLAVQHIKFDSDELSRDRVVSQAAKRATLGENRDSTGAELPTNAAQEIVRLQAMVRSWKARREVTRSASRQWIEYYVSQRQYDKARELGWDGQVDDQQKEEGCAVM